MFRPRIIPVLLLKNLGLVKSVKFKNHRYIGDPINAVKIFNDKKADELIFLDINASKEDRLISLDFVQKVGDESNMPFGVGGGIKSVEDIRKILNLGAEKVVINSIAVTNPDFIKEAADKFGSSTIVVCIDIKKKMFIGNSVTYMGGSKYSKIDPVGFAQLMCGNGAGEIIVQSVDNDGTFSGYDLEITRKIAEAVTIPVVALGGAADYNDFRKVVKESHASAAAAGSIFVYHGPRRAVLISFPTNKELQDMF